MNNSDRYRSWLKRVREISGDPIIEKGWFLPTMIEGNGIINGFTVPREHVSEVRTKLQRVAQQLSPRDRHYDMTLDHVRMCNEIILNNLPDMSQTWRD